MPTFAERYREAYLTQQPTTVLQYLDLVESIDPNSNMQDRNGQVWIEFSDGSEWRLGATEDNAGKMRHHDA